MEKKKILLVSISVGVFLVVVIGASILVFSPRNPVPAVSKAQVPERPIPAGSQGSLGTQGSLGSQGSPDSLTPSGVTGYPVPGDPATGISVYPPTVQPATVDPADMLRNSSGLQGLQTPPSSASAVQENRFYINNDGSGTDQPFLIERKEGDSNTRVVINVPRPSATAVPSAAPASRPAPTPAAGPAPARSTPAPGSAAAQGNAAPPRSGSAAPKPAAVPARAAAVAARPAAQAQTPTPRNYDAFWVQTGSFAAKVRADGVKETLSSKGITAIIENRDVEGRTFYRVRVGPYTSRNEADYWLSLIKSINGFEDSQVWKSQVRQ
jgi:DedD protein